MGKLAKHIDEIQHAQDVLRPVLEHFDTRKLNQELIDSIKIAADLAFSDALLFEKFEMWNEQRDDDVLLFHIKRFFEKKDRKPISEKERNLSSRREEIETSIKNSAREDQKKIFGARLTALAVEKGLDTNKKLGDFLGVSDEQARKFRSGENKPQLATLKQISEKFKVSVEFLIGLVDDRIKIK